MKGDLFSSEHEEELNSKPDENFNFFTFQISRLHEMQNTIFTE